MNKIVLLMACMLYTAGVLAQSSKGNKLQPATFIQTISCDFEDYINQAQQEISENDKRIAALLSKLVGQKSTGDKKLPHMVQWLVKNIVILERYNEELRTELDNYVTYGTGDWKLFKKEFSRNLADFNKDLAELRIIVYDYFIV